MTEDSRLARKAVRNDARRMTRDLRRNGMPVDAITFDQVNEAPIDAEMMIAFTLGSRGLLTKHAARQAAKAWQAIRAKSPSSPICPCFLGYDDDPRELHEFPEVLRYLRWWARAAGLDDFATVFEQYRDPLRFPHLLALLAVSGVFADDIPDWFKLTLPATQKPQ